MKKAFVVFLLILSILALVGYFLIVDNIGVNIGAGDFECQIFLDKTVQISYYGGSDEEVEIPPYIDGYKVVGITSYAFSGSPVKKVILPDTIEFIETAAFNECYLLEEIKLPEGLKVISDGAFYGCENLKSITLPDSLESVGYNAFGECKRLESIYIGANVSNIGDFANRFNEFSYDFVQSVSERYDGILLVWNTLFDGCESLRSITVSEKNCSYASVDNVIYSKDFKQLIYYPNGKEESNFTVPYGVEEISSYGFAYNEHLTSVEISESVKKIGNDAFLNCEELTEVVFENPQGWSYGGQKAVLDRPEKVAEWFKCGTPSGDIVKQ